MSHFSIRIRQIPHIILLESVGRDKITWSNSQQYVYYEQLQASGPSIIIGPAARAFLRPQEDLWRAWGNVCREGVALIMSLDPLPRRFCFVLFCFFSRPDTYFVVGNKRPYRSTDIDGLLASSCQSIDQSDQRKYSTPIATWLYVFSSL